MALNFNRVAPASEELEIWSATERDFSFVISYESRNGPGLHGQPGFVASWRPINFNRPAIRVGGSPFKTFAEAEKACETMLAHRYDQLSAWRGCKRRPQGRGGNIVRKYDPLVLLLGSVIGRSIGL